MELLDAETTIAITLKYFRAPVSEEYSEDLGIKMVSPFFHVIVGSLDKIGCGVARARSFGLHF